MNQRIAKKLRKEMNDRQFPTEADKRETYREVKKNYTEFGFLNSQRPKMVLNKAERRMQKFLNKMRQRNEHSRVS